MNIKEAKKEIINTFRAYTRKDKQGNYCYPTVNQRPILLIGPPGIGKTAIMKQAADECQVGFVSYTMTHHTRQSAVGLPVIEQSEFEGNIFSVTHYTMSEIIASIYECMKKTGKNEGILFLDEINCVSETLTPTMLQLLQNKMFGNHRIPKGWVIVAAGNPPEYNKSVKEFDMVTLDRVRHIEIEADFEVWREYGYKNHVHGAIISYLNVKRDKFYMIENAADRKYFVTARGWEDLSELLKGYEELGIEIGKSQIFQFVQHEKGAEDFYAYYQLYMKYGEDYSIIPILKNKIDPGTKNKKIELLKKSDLSERFMIIDILLDYLNNEIYSYKESDLSIKRLHEILQNLKVQTLNADTVQIFSDFAEKFERSLEIKKEQEIIKKEELFLEIKAASFLKKTVVLIKKNHILEKEEAFEKTKAEFTKLVEERKDKITNLQLQIQNAFRFILEGFGNGQEMIQFLSGIHNSQDFIEFIAEFGCAEYFKFSKHLLIKNQEQYLREEVIKVLSDNL